MWNSISDKFYYCLGVKRSNKWKRYFNLLFNRKLKNELLLNKKFYNIHKGERCFIIGNGPSLKDFDFSLLSSEITFTVNQFSRFENFEKININYHVFSDERFFALDENNPSDLETLKYLQKIGQANSNIQFFSKYNSRDYIENSKYFMNYSVNYYTDGLIFYDNYNLDCDICKPIPWFPTCIDYCIFIAMYMGFKEIYLLGCDCTGFLRVATIADNSKDFSYGYNVSESEERRLKKQLETYGVADELEIHAKLFRYYEYMEKFSVRNNVKIINCTDGGILNTFDREKLENILQ